MKWYWLNENNDDNDNDETIMWNGMCVIMIWWQ